ncbi:MAG: DUF305 domain-containing protein [Arenimonas sp.]|nr:DUF305 domain-containing protein [Arenimonas sp.]
MVHGSAGGHYGRFAWMLGLSFVAMYVLMYAMVDRLGNAVPNINQFYMAGLMTAPMAILEILLMARMYPDKRKNTTILLLGAVVLAACWFGIRAQAGVGDRQFLKSMIPHHAGAILMCEQASLTQPDVKALCDGIVKAQEEEIARMRALLAR